MKHSVPLPPAIFPNPGASAGDGKTDIQAAFDRALAHHQQDRLPEAETGYREVLAHEQNHADAWHLLGLVAHQAGKNDLAIDLIGRAIQLNKTSAAYYTNLAVVAKAAGRREEALAAYVQAALLDPASADIPFNRGLLLADLGRMTEAEASYRHAIALRADFPAAHAHLGMLFNEMGQPAQALVSYDCALALQPANAFTHFNRALALWQLGELEGALRGYRVALAIKPDFAEAHLRIGNLFKQQKKFEEASEAYEAALALRPAYAEAQCNLGLVHHARDRLSEAADAYRASLAAEPRLSEAWLNLGNVLREQGQLHDALAAYQEVLQIEPNHAEAHFNRALPLLLMGELESGFRAYEWRLRIESVKFAKCYPGKELLADLNVSGRTILLQAEQGLGDTMQLCRYAPLLANAGARVILEVPRSMLRLFGTLPGIYALHAKDSPLPEFDTYLPLMSLPHLFGTTLASIPSSAPYLFAEPEACAQWRERLGSHGFKIGIAWQGNPDAAAEKGRSAPLAALAPLAAIPGVRLISLQKTHGLDQLASVPSGMQVESLGDGFDGGPDAFIDTVGVMMNLDLIVTVDTSIGHLAGALGRPAWIALQKIPHWIWMLERPDSPWYPSVRLFRQAVSGEWDVPFAAMAKEIENMKGYCHAS